METTWVIRGPKDKDGLGGDYLFWNNRDGWGGRIGAARFSHAERHKFSLPVSDAPSIWQPRWVPAERVLSSSDANWLMSLVRMDLRADIKTLERFAVRPGQTKDEADAFKASMEAKVAYKTAVLEKLTLIRKEEGGN